jgi:Tfp pilus assembly protein PilV
MVRARARALRVQLTDDSGFGLVEAVVAGMVLMLFATGVYGVLTTTLGVSKVDRQRVAASSLAQREVEATSGSITASNTSALALVNAGQVVNPLPAGSPTASSTATVVDGVSYTVTRTARFIVRGTGTNSCDGGTAVSYPNIQVGVTVTWPDMKSVRPVTTSTVIAPAKNLLASSYAFVAIAVKDYQGVVVSGRTVTATGPSTQVQTTDASGCALFGLATAGAYTFTLNEPGWVDGNGYVTSSKPLTVTAGTFAPLQTMTYARSGTLSADLKAPAGYALPVTAVPVSISNVKLPAGPRSAATAAGVGSFADVAPWTDGYLVYAGACTDSNPAGTPTNSAAQTPTVVAPWPPSTSSSRRPRPGSPSARRARRRRAARSPRCCSSARPVPRAASTPRCPTVAGP